MFFDTLALFDFSCVDMILLYFEQKHSLKHDRKQRLSVKKDYIKILE